MPSTFRYRGNQGSTVTINESSILPEASILSKRMLEMRVRIFAGLLALRTYSTNSSRSAEKSYSPSTTHSVDPRVESIDADDFLPEWLIVKATAGSSDLPLTIL